MSEGSSRLDRALADLLSYGIALASLLITVGLALPTLVEPITSERLVIAGIAVIVALPVVRVVIMGLSFTRTGDRDFAGAAVMVLLIIAVASVIGATAG